MFVEHFVGEALTVILMVGFLLVLVPTLQVLLRGGKTLINKSPQNLEFEKVTESFIEPTCVDDHNDRCVIQAIQELEERNKRIGNGETDSCDNSIRSP